LRGSTCGVNGKQINEENIMGQKLRTSEIQQDYGFKISTTRFVDSGQTVCGQKYRPFFGALTRNIGTSIWLLYL
jgi:hypothetical protein